MPTQLPIRRLTTRPLPPYSYVPGMWPHPESDPTGHSFGHHKPIAERLTEVGWRTNETWLWAIDLFNHGYYWESHEAWEGLWHATGREGPVADLLKGLIKLAAAGVKAREGNTDGVRRHAARATELLAPFRGTLQFGVDVEVLLAAAAMLECAADQRLPLSRASVERVLPIVIHLDRNPNGDERT